MWVQMGRAVVFPAEQPWRPASYKRGLPGWMMGGRVQHAINESTGRLAVVFSIKEAPAGPLLLILSRSLCFFFAKLLMHEWPGKTEGKHQKCVWSVGSFSFFHFFFLLSLFCCQATTEQLDQELQIVRGRYLTEGGIGWPQMASVFLQVRGQVVGQSSFCFFLNSCFVWPEACVSSALLVWTLVVCPRTPHHQNTTHWPLLSRHPWWCILLRLDIFCHWFGALSSVFQPLWTVR